MSSSDEIAETERLLAAATFPGVKAALSAHLQKLKSASEKKEVPRVSASSSPAAVEAAAPPRPPASFTSRPAGAGGATNSYVSITDIAWDQGEYNTSNLNIYVDLPGVGGAKDRVTCDFGQHSFDMIVTDLDGKNYRLLKDNLEKDIVPAECTFKVKANKVVIKLCKVKGEFSYETWQNLLSKKKREAGDQKKSKADPMGGLMDMMKDMYADGDDATRKVIGEAMMKSRTGGGADAPPPMDMMDDLGDGM
jgi:calcyclin binding protein